MEKRKEQKEREEGEREEGGKEGEEERGEVTWILSTGRELPGSGARGSLCWSRGNGGSIH